MSSSVLEAPPRPQPTRRQRTVEEAFFDDAPWLPRNSRNNAVRWSSRFNGWTYDWESLPQDQRIRATLHQLSRFRFEGEGIGPTTRMTVFTMVWGTGRAIDWMIFHALTGAAHVVSILSPLAGWAAANSAATTQLVRFLERLAGKRQARRAAFVERSNSRRAARIREGRPSLFERMVRSKHTRDAITEVLTGIARAQLWAIPPAGRFVSGFITTAPIALIFLTPPMAAFAGLAAATLRWGLPYTPVQEKIEEHWEKFVDWIKNVESKDGRKVFTLPRAQRHGKKKFGRAKSDRVSLHDLDPSFAAQQTDPDSGRDHRYLEDRTEGVEVHTLLTEAPDIEAGSFDYVEEGKTVGARGGLALVQEVLGPMPPYPARSRAAYLKLAGMFAKFAVADDMRIKLLAGEPGERPLIGVVLQLTSVLQQMEREGSEHRLNLGRFGPVFRRAVAEALDLKDMETRRAGLPVVLRVAQDLLADDSGLVRNRAVREVVEHCMWKTDPGDSAGVKVAGPADVVSRVRAERARFSRVRIDTEAPSPKSAFELLVEANSVDANSSARQVRQFQDLALRAMQDASPDVREIAHAMLVKSATVNDRGMSVTEAKMATGAEAMTHSDGVAAATLR